ncbi:MAG TPA: SDR family oxidoreductase [Labilithrix sp.]
MTTSRRHALVLGGTGVIGGAVLAAFARAGLPTTFTYRRSEERAHALATQYGHTAARIDLENADEIRALYTRLETAPDVLVHCAAVHVARTLADTTCEELDASLRIAGRATLVATQELARRLEEEKRPGHVVLVGALDRTQSLPLSFAFAAAQGMMGAIAMALAKELGHQDVRVNLVAGGPTGSGVSATLAPSLLRDYEKLSALRRLGTPDEIAAAVAFLALENESMTGKVFAANGGI